MTKFPFTLVTGLTAQFALLNSGSGVAPAFDLPLPLRNTIRVDLAIFNPIAIVIRYLLGVAVTIGLTLYIVRFWRGN